MAVLSNNMQSFSQDEAIYDFKAAKHKKESKKSTDLTVSLQALSKTPLGKVLEKDPVWQTATGQGPTKVILKEDLSNFFLLIFKFMKADRAMNNQLQLSSVASMIVQNHMLETLSSEAVANMKAMDDKVAQAMNDTPDFWKTVVAPIAVMIACIVIGAALGGIGSEAAPALEEAVAPAVEDAAEAAVSNGASEVVENAVADTAEQAGADAAKKGVEEAANEEAKKSLGRKLLDGLMNNKLKVLGAIVAMSGTTFPMMLQAGGAARGDHSIVDYSGEEVQTAVSKGSAEMNITSASIEGAQGRVKQETQSQQNSASNEQADLSMLQQMIQAQQQAFGLGKL